MKAITPRSRLMSWAVALALVGVAGTITPALAGSFTCGTSCTGAITIGGVTTTVPVTVDPNTGIGTISNFTVASGGVVATITSAIIDPDPAIIFSVAATNNTNSDFLFAFAFTDAPFLLSGSIDASSSIGYTLTDGFPVGLGGTSGVTLGAVLGHVLTAFDNPGAVNKGVDVGDTVFAGSPPCTAKAGPTYTCTPFSADNTFTGGPFTSMHALIAFTLSAHDAASLSGSVFQQQSPSAVPEPATLLLMSSGLLGLGAWRRYSALA